MHLIYLIPTLLLLLYTCVSATDIEFTFPSKVPGWKDLRACLRNCMASGCDTVWCSSSPVADALECPTKDCMCLVDYRADALDTLTICVAEACDTTNEPSQAVDIFNTYCGGVVVYATSTVHPVSNFNATPTDYMWTHDMWWTDYIQWPPTATETVYLSKAQRGAVLLWDTLITLMMSLVGAIIWDLVAV